MGHTAVIPPCQYTIAVDSFQAHSCLATTLHVFQGAGRHAEQFGFVGTGDTPGDGDVAQLGTNGQLGWSSDELDHRTQATFTGMRPC